MKVVFTCALSMFSLCLWNCNAKTQTGTARHEANTSNINTKIRVSCSKQISVTNSTTDGVLVEGENVMLSDLVDVTGHLHNFCNISKRHNNESAGTFVILSSDSFVIDEDLNGGDLNLVVISPRWVAFGNRTISLNGLDGGLKNLINKNSKVNSGGTGHYGLSGEPGKTGGYFLGIGETFINGINLSITANGGAGSPGSGGSNGGNGLKGISPVKLQEEDLNCATARKCIEKVTIRVYSTSFLCGNQDYNNLRDSPGADMLNCSSKTNLDPKTSKETCRIEIYGLIGKKGGDGGGGGSGGPGGNPGIIELIDLSETSGVSLQHQRGEPGEDGEGGPGGEGGTRGDPLVYYITEEKGKLVNYSTERIISTERSPNGRTNKKKSEPFANPYPPRTLLLGPTQVDTIVREYGDFLRKSIKKTDLFRQKYLTSFYSHVDSKTYIKKCTLYSIPQLMDVLRGLEEDYSKFNRPDDFLAPYETLLEKIRAHMEPSCLGVEIKGLSGQRGISQKTWETQVNSERVKVLRYLYTATLGRVYSMKSHQNTIVITDIGEYLNSVQKIIEELKEVKGERNKFLMVLSKLNKIKQVKEDFKKYITKKFEEVNQLISKTILPAIDKINNKTMKSVDHLLDEIKNLRREHEQRLEQLEEEKEKLKTATILSGILGVLKVVTVCIGFIPVVGPFFGAAANVAITGTEAIIENSYLQGADVKAMRNVVFEMKDLEVMSFKNSLTDDEGGNRVDNKKTPNKNKSNKMKLIKMRFNKEKIRGILENGTKVLEGINDVASGVRNLVAGVKRDKDKMEVLEEQIDNEKENLHKLKELEDYVRGSFADSFKRMGDSFKSAKKSLEGQSHAVLIVAKWKVQTNLRNVMSTIKGVTSGFKVQEEMLKNVHDMEDTMKTLIELFDQIQNYQDQQRMANFVADIATAAATDVNITNPHYRNITHHLELLISSNLVLQKYQEAVNAFKQFVFPFAHLYFNGLTLPAHITVKDSLEELVNTATTQVNHLVKRLNEYKQAVKKQDNIIGVGTFSSEFESTKPFYVWKNKNNRETIAKLLSCEEVVLNADVKNSPKFEDAIKFKIIEFSFKATHEHKHLQPKINGILKKFEVSATHMGNSYYRYQNKTYVITSNSLSFWYNIEKNKHNKPVRRDISYDKLSKGDYSLSPYAVWKVQISDLTDDYDCNDLKEFADKVDVELVGEGFYVRAKRENQIKLEVDKYYKGLAVDQTDEKKGEEKHSNIDALMKVSEQRREDRAEERFKWEVEKAVKKEMDQKTFESYRKPLSL